MIELKLYADAGYEIEHNNTILDSMKKEPIFHRDEFFYVVEEWNKLRAEVLRILVNDILLPQFAREAHERLMEEGRDYVIRVIKFYFKNKTFLAFGFLKNKAF